MKKLLSTKMPYNQFKEMVSDPGLTPKQIVQLLVDRYYNKTFSFRTAFLKEHNAVNAAE